MAQNDSSILQYAQLTSLDEFWCDFDVETWFPTRKCNAAEMQFSGRLTFGHSIRHNFLLDDPIDVIISFGETRLVELSIDIK